MAPRNSGTAWAYPTESKVAKPSSSAPAVVASFRGRAAQDRVRHGGGIDLAGQAPRVQGRLKCLEKGFAGQARVALSQATSRV